MREGGAVKVMASGYKMRLKRRNNFTVSLHVMTTEAKQGIAVYR